MPKFEELPRSCCLTLKAFTAFRNELYQDTQATSAYSFSRLVLQPWEQEVKASACTKFVTPAVLIPRGLGTGWGQRPVGKESWRRRKEHSLGHLHQPVKADEKSPKAVYTVNRKWRRFRTEIKQRQWQRPENPVSGPSVLKSGWCKQWWGTGGRQYHDREEVQIPQQHRNCDMWDRESMKVRYKQQETLSWLLMEEIKMQFWEWQEQSSEEVEIHEEKKYRWHRIAQFVPSVALSMSYYIWNTWQFDKLALTSVILWIHIFIYWKQGIFLFTAKFSGS